MTPVRVVCQNTLNLALGTAKRIWTARHTENVLLRVQDARETLQLANSYMGELGKGIHELTTIKLSDRKVQEFINEFFPITEDSDRWPAEEQPALAGRFEGSLLQCTRSGVGRKERLAVCERCFRFCHPCRPHPQDPEL